MQTFWKEKIIITIENCKIYGYLPCYYYYFVTSIINNFFIDLNILNIDVFSPAGNQHHETIYYYFIIIIDLKTQNKRKKKIFISCR